MNWLDPNSWPAFSADAQKAMFQPWAGLSTIPGFGSLPGAPSGAATPGEGPWQINDLVKRAMEGWTAFAQAGVSRRKSGDATPDPGLLQKLFNPDEWSRAMTGGISASLQRLTEAPTYATPTNLDRKVSNAQKLWVERAKDVQGYQQVVQAAWTRAFLDFTRRVNDPKSEALTSGRAVLDLWLSVANEALLEMHHRPEFLEAQRKMTRSSAEYRLAEQELAEVFCSTHHIPTRTEMDEVQKTIHELKRELRAMRRQGATKG